VADQEIQQHKSNSIAVITNKDSKLTLVWKEVRRFNSQQSMNRIKNRNPDIKRTKIAVAEATTVEELVTATNVSLKITETVLNKLIDSSSETKGRINEAEKKQIRAELEKEHLKLLGHDLDLQDCNKTNGMGDQCLCKGQNDQESLQEQQR
jgi:hypothetical protein